MQKSTTQLLGFLGILILISSPELISLSFENISKEEILNEPTPFGSSFESVIERRGGLSQEYKSYAVLEGNTGALLAGDNLHDPLPMASLVKLFLASAVLEHRPVNFINIIRTDLQAEGDQGLTDGLFLPLEDAMKTLLVASSNDVALALDRQIKMTNDNGEEMDLASFIQDEAKEKGLVSVVIKNVTGLDDTLGNPSVFASALDISRMHMNLYKNFPEVLSSTTESEVEVKGDRGVEVQTFLIENTNKSLINTPEIISSKTGFTESAGGCLSVIFDSGLDHPIVITVMGSTMEGRFELIDELIDVYSEALDLHY
jgi:serine-type D-Ala-D-Ala carboxypeptidase (penicillin-binding protein 5/6)